VGEPGAVRADHQLSDGVKDESPRHAQEIYEEAFDSDEEQYGWGAAPTPRRVERGRAGYEKNDEGNRVQK